MTLRSPAGRDSRADEARQKIRKVGELIRLRQKIKTDVSNVSEEAALVASLDKAAAELDAGKGVPLERVRENIREWATSPKNSKK
jgi:hypothetical protein